MILHDFLYFLMVFWSSESSLCKSYKSIKVEYLLLTGV